MKLNLKMILTAAGTMVLVSSTVWAKKVEYRKTQTVNFDQMDVDGRAVTPIGSFVANKPGLSLVPLYKVRKNFDDNIKESAEYVK
jgi:ethanolamine utilization protein EutP (predicted NTPase)